MPHQRRIALIGEIERIRGSRVICYLTSLRPGVPSQIAEDQVRIFFDHLMELPVRPTPKLDVFLCSNGGNGTVPWRLVALFREYATSFNVLIPYRAYSAASLLALGADEIVMHPFAELGPIDPTVSNEFNPIDPQGRRLGISVEDVRAYIGFIKETVGITHEDELIQAVRVLAEKVHPLALGNVERFVMQSRMIATKILKTHMREDTADHKISQIVETMASKLYFHGHPINRIEARNDLRLKVAESVDSGLEKAMWDLYVDFENDFRNQDQFNPHSSLVNAPLTPSGTREHQEVMLHAVIESICRSSAYRTTRRYTLLPTPPGQVAIQEDPLTQGWNHSLVPSPAPANPPSTT